MQSLNRIWFRYSVAILYAKGHLFGTIDVNREFNNENVTKFVNLKKKKYI